MHAITRAPTPIISLWQPWATWIADGIKTIESRTHDRFKGLVGKRIGIHAAKRFDKTAPNALDKHSYPYGVILCTAKVVEHRELTPDDAQFVNMEEQEMFGRYGLFLDDVQTHRVFYVKGQQGIWYSKDYDQFLKRLS